MFTTQERISTKLLGCGTSDLTLLEDIKYDLDDILDYLVKNNMLSLNQLLSEVFAWGKEELQSAYCGLFKDLLKEYNDCYDDAEVDAKLDIKGRISDLESTNLEEDFTWFCNCLDTHVYLANYEIYEMCFEEELMKIEYNMGFKFTR